MRDDAPVARPWWGTAPYGVLAALLGLLVALIVAGDKRAAAGPAADQLAQRTAVLTAARQEALNLTTLDYRHAARDVDRILAAATGELQQRFASERSRLPGVLAQDHSVSAGAVIAAGVVDLAGAEARVLVAADAKVTTGLGRQRGSVLKHYRMVLHLVLQQGRWLVDNVAFSGLPQ